MDLSRLQIFNAVAQLENISRASEKLDLSQSTVSRAIMELEQSFGSKLVNRTSRGITLTAQGERVFGFSNKILQEANLFEKLFHEQEDETPEDEIRGDIKIATTPFFGTNWLIPRLKDFLEENQKIHVSIALKSEGIDLSDSDIVIRPFMPNQSNMVQKYIETFTMKLFASKNYLDKFGIPKTIQDLDNHRLISFRQSHDPYGDVMWHLQIGREKDQPIRVPYFEINSLAGMFESARLGFGIATLPALTNILNSDLIEVLPEVVGSQVKVYFIFPEERLHSKKIIKLAEYLERHLKEPSAS